MVAVVAVPLAYSDPREESTAVVRALEKIFVLIAPFIRDDVSLVIH
jgi:hypothetical protein